jgi:hypothetical protein
MARRVLHRRGSLTGADERGPQQTMRMNIGV